MALAIHTTCGNHAGPRSERGLEIYATPPSAVERLIEVEKLPHGCWEICGDETSAIARVLREHGHYVVCNDIRLDGTSFLDHTKAPKGMGCVVTNPPFSRAADLVRHALTLVKKVVVLERIQFLESVSRADIMGSGGPLARIHVFARRLPRMHKAGWNGKRAAPAMMLGWFVFERNHVGPAEILRIE